MNASQIDTAVTTRARVRIRKNNGWAAGAEGIALGFRSLYGNIKVGFVDASGEYTGEYTMVPYESVDLVTEEEDHRGGIVGLKRIMALVEVTYAADDTRDLNTLTQVTAQAISDGVVAQNGTLARIGIQGAAVDPDPEPTVPEEPAEPPVYSPEPLDP